MGIKATDLNILSPTGPTATIPVNKDRRAVFFQVTRTLTANTPKIVLPGDASLTGITIFASTNSNAGTTATVTITASNNGGVFSTGTVNLLTNGATTGAVQMSALPNLENIPINGDIIISAVYAETGTASSAGGPWNFEVNFVR